MAVVPTGCRDPSNTNMGRAIRQSNRLLLTHRGLAELVQCASLRSPVDAPLRFARRHCADLLSA